ncbi:MAG: ATP-binding protein [Bacteroidales bacterium]|nr:ATP-binding protein [Bacteroidales bacterium]
MVFGRKKYLEQLISLEGNGMIKIVTGIRRCGKSFLLFNLYKDYLLNKGIRADHIIEVNLENRRNKKLRDPDMLLEYIDSKILDEAHYYVLLDEIQLVPEFEDVLNSYLSMPNVDVYVTGSNAKFLSSDVITEFRGRGWEIRVHPLSFAEYYEAVGGDEQRTLNDYYLYGGLPAVALMDSDQQKQDYLTEVFETVYLKDILQRNHLRKVNGLRELVRILASSIGSGLNVKKIANTFKSESNMDVSPITIASYLEHLQDAFIVNEAMRYDVKGRKYIGTETKYYFEDVGVRNAIIGFRQIEMNHSMENVIYNELRHLGYTVDVGMVEVMKRDAEGKQYRTRLEVDFVVNRHDQRLYIQSAYRIPDKEKMEQEQASLLHIPDAFRKIIIDGDRYTSNYNNNGVLMIGVCDFLMHPEKISS